MFDSLRQAFSNITKTLVEKDLDEDTLDEVLSDLEMSLLESDVALEVVDNITDDLKKRLVGKKVNKNQIEEFVRESMINTLSSMFQEAGTIDILYRIRQKNASGNPYLILLLGINGTGKTTTLAKLAYMLKQNNVSVVAAAADTFRAGAIEQIQEHAKKLQVKLIAQNYNSDPAAVARDAALYARSHKINCVLVDTAGRIQTSTNLMQQIEKITKVVEPDLKIFVGDSLAGNDVLSQAREFHEYTKFDCSILTKSDADAKGGAAISIVKITSKPIVFMGVGQEYPDLEPFRRDTFVDTLLGGSGMKALLEPPADIPDAHKTPEPPADIPDAHKTPEPPADIPDAHKTPEPPADIPDAHKTPEPPADIPDAHKTPEPPADIPDAHKTPEPPADIPDAHKTPEPPADMTYPTRTKPPNHPRILFKAYLMMILKNTQ